LIKEKKSNKISSNKSYNPSTLAFHDLDSRVNVTRLMFNVHCKLRKTSLH